MSSAVQLSGLAERIGMAQSTQVVQTKMLDYFFSLRKLHRIAFQPIVELATGQLYEYECLFRPDMPMLPQSIGSVVQAAIDTDRGVELDVYIVATVLEQVGRLEADGRKRRHRAAPVRDQPDARSACSIPRSTPQALAALVRGAGLEPRQITIECTEQQSVPDIGVLQRQVKALRKAGFGFAVDDAGAGYASFSLIAALRPSVIKIDREIIHGIGHDDAKQALVEAFVSFGRRIGAHLARRGHRAAGRPRRADGARRRVRPGLPARPAGVHADAQPRRLDRVGRAAEAKRKTRASVARLARQGADPTDPGPRRARVPSRA